MTKYADNFAEQQQQYERRKEKQLHVWRMVSVKMKIEQPDTTDKTDESWNNKLVWQLAEVHIKNNTKTIYF